MPFAAITSIHRRIAYLQRCMAGIVPPWYRQSCETLIAALQREAEQLCLDC